jgi:hypothetical protein
VTRQARLVLEDCEAALAELTDGLTGSVWRRRWLATISLLWAVGEVLKKVDMQALPKTGQVIIDAEWKIWRKEPIYKDFIYDERNHFVHAYSLGAGQNVTARLGGVPALYSYSMNRGRFRGQDPRTVAQEAIGWWKNYLDRVDELISKGP